MARLRRLADSHVRTDRLVNGSRNAPDRIRRKSLNKDHE
jgi:hypothetical protein